MFRELIGNKNRFERFFFPGADISAGSDYWLLTFRYNRSKSRLIGRRYFGVDRANRNVGLLACFEEKPLSLSPSPSLFLNHSRSRSLSLSLFSWDTWLAWHGIVFGGSLPLFLRNPSLQFSSSSSSSAAFFFASLADSFWNRRLCWSARGSFAALAFSTSTSLLFLGLLLLLSLPLPLVLLLLLLDALPDSPLDRKRLRWSVFGSETETELQDEREWTTFFEGGGEFQTSFTTLLALRMRVRACVRSCSVPVCVSACVFADRATHMRERVRKPTNTDCGRKGVGERERFFIWNAGTCLRKLRKNLAFPFFAEFHSGARKHWSSIYRKLNKRFIIEFWSY